MTKTPYEFMARLNADGTVAGCHVRYQYNVAGKLIDGDPETVSLNDAAYTQFANAFNAAAVAQSQQLTTDLAAANTAKDAAIQAKDQAESQVATLQARIAELEAVPQIATNFQIRAWLITNHGVGIIDQVKSLIAAIPDPVEKVLAEQQWEYANNVFRNNPFVERIGTALGLTTQQLDAAYAEACQIQ